MLDKYLKYINRYRKVAIYVLLFTIAIGFLLLVVSSGSYRFETKSAPTTFEPASVATSSEMVGEVLTESLPVRLLVPTANIDTTFEQPLGLDELGALAVPDGYEQVGWYKYGPTPGEIGPAVIVGHVDSLDGPAVFYSLGQVGIGDELYVEREDSSTAVFEVTNYERLPQSEFPTEKVYGNINFAGLRLITCTGKYSHDNKRYSHNLIVYAKLVRVE